MALLGRGALAMFWDLSPEIRDEFQDWHAHEHYRERLSLPGFLRATRWRDAGGAEGMFQMYELADYATLSSPAYLARLNAPTPWSARMMPHHRNMVRCQCHVLESGGNLLASHLLIVRLSPATGREDGLRESLRALIGGLVDRPGFTGAHLLRHETPAIAPTAEQKLRGQDRAADWILLVAGYDRVAVEALGETELALPALAGLGAASGAIAGLYTLACSALPAEFG